MIPKSSSTAPVVCILTAGQGKRMGAYGHSINKAILPLGQRAIISHIIEKFPADSTFVIGLGHQAQQVRSYLTLAHPEQRFEFVHVENYAGPKSGPGHSLLCCKHFLNRPFFFVSCDTLWEGEIEFDAEQDWFGVSQVSSERSASYCNFQVRDGKIIAIKDKQRVEGPEFGAFIGLCFIFNHRLFWDGLSKPAMVAGEHQVSSGIEALVETGNAEVREVLWTDVGNEASFRDALARHHDFDFSKTDEAIYIVDGRVVKFFVDEKISAGRVARCKANPKVFPRIIAEQSNFYAYELAPGRTMYETLSPPLFSKFLLDMKDRLWIPQNIPTERVQRACEKFYRQKTTERLAVFQRKYPDVDRATRVNGISVPASEKLLNAVPWKTLCDGRAVFFHGDLQFDNVLYDEKSDKFTLLDWRQDFAGESEFGDQYYDLGKLLGGVRLNYDYIKRNLFSYYESGSESWLDFAQRSQAPAYEKILFDFIESEKLDATRVKFLVPLIYLNMSPLHQPPFDRLLFDLGRLLLAQQLGG